MTVSRKTKYFFWFLYEDASLYVFQSKELMSVEKDMNDSESMLKSENDEAMTEMLREEKVQLNNNKHDLLDAIIKCLAADNTDVGEYLWVCSRIN